MTNEEYAKIVARNLRRILFDREMTQTDVARALQMPKTTVSGWFNAYRVPRMENIVALCDLFGVSRSDIMDDKGGYYEKSKMPEFLLEAEKLNSDGRARLLEYARFLAQNPDYRKGGGRE